MGSNMIEICSNCKREITKAEQAYIFNDMIVCSECDRKLRVGTSVKEVEVSLCEPEEQEKERVSHNGKKTILASSVFFVLTVGLVLYFFIFNNERFDNQAVKADLQARATVSQAEKTELKGWPFVTEIPVGFEFEQRKVWEGRIFWILKGSQFGQAHKTIIVVRSTPQTRSNDALRAPYWAAELSVGLSIDESPRGQKVAIDDEAFSVMILPVSGNHDQVLFSPTGKKAKPKKKAPQSRTVGGVTLPPMPELLDLSSPKILLAKLGKPEDFVPGGLSAWAGRSEGTLLLAACASEAKDFEFGGQYGPMLAELCHNLRQEPGEKYEAPDPMRDILKELVPEGYTFERRKGWAGMTLWLFKGKKLGKVQETLVAVHWKESKSFPFFADDPFMALTNCARWAGAYSVNKKLNTLSTTLAKPEEMGIVVKDENGQYKLSHPFVGTSESTKGDGEDKERSFSLSLRNLMTIGKQIGNVHCISFDDSDKIDDTPVRVSVISRAVSLKSEKGGFIVFAGATEGIPDEFWHITQTVDKFVDAYVRRIQQEF